MKHPSFSLLGRSRVGIEIARTSSALSHDYLVEFQQIDCASAPSSLLLYYKDPVSLAFLYLPATLRTPYSEQTGVTSCWLDHVADWKRHPVHRSLLEDRCRNRKCHHGPVSPQTRTATYKALRL